MRLLGRHQKQYGADEFKHDCLLYFVKNEGMVQITAYRLNQTSIKVVN